MRTRLIRAVAAIILVVAVHAPAMPAAAQPMDFVDVHETMRKSLVYVTAEGYDEKGIPTENQATGTIIHDSGVVMTAHHVLDGLDKAVDGSVKLAGRVGGKYGFPTLLTVLREYPQYDLLLLAFPDVWPKLTPACLDLDVSIEKGVRLGTSGFPGAIDYAADEGTLASKFGPPGRPGLWRVNDMPFNKGQSGSPVYSVAGKVVGIAQGAITNAEGLHYFQPLNAAASIVRDAASCSNLKFTPTVLATVGDRIRERIKSGQEIVVKFDSSSAETSCGPQSANGPLGFLVAGETYRVFYSPADHSWQAIGPHQAFSGCPLATRYGPNNIDPKTQKPYPDRIMQFNDEDNAVNVWAGRMTFDDNGVLHYGQVVGQIILGN